MRIKYIYKTQGDITNWFIDFMGKPLPWSTDYAFKPMVFLTVWLNKEQS